MVMCITKIITSLMNQLRKSEFIKLELFKFITHIFHVFNVILSRNIKYRNH